MWWMSRMFGYFSMTVENVRFQNTPKIKRGKQRWVSVYATMDWITVCHEVTKYHKNLSFKRLKCKNMRKWSFCRRIVLIQVYPSDCGNEVTCFLLLKKIPVCEQKQRRLIQLIFQSSKTQRHFTSLTFEFKYF